MIDPDQNMMIKYKIVKMIKHLRIEKLTVISIVFNANAFIEISWNNPGLLIVVTKCNVSEKGCAKSTSQVRVLLWKITVLYDMGSGL